MIAKLSGKFQDVLPTSLIIDCTGVGYEVLIGLKTFELISETTEGTLFIHHVVREDAQLLYGFSSPLEKQLFKLLLSVSGVGPSSALAIVSTYSSEEIYSSIQNGESALLQKVKGIGVKTAQKIVIDLKDKLGKVIDVNSLEKYDLGQTSLKQEALDALQVLGVNPKTAQKKVEMVIKENPSISLQEIIKEVLKR